MKTKFTLETPNKTKEFSLKRQSNTFVAFYDGQEYPCLPQGTIVTFNNIQRTVLNGINIIDLDGDYILITDKGKFAGPSVQCEKGNKINYNFLMNNFRAGFSLFFAFIIVMIVILIIMII
ncbi:MAG: hypothetical protein J1F31_00195 [Erysipelotrichales bacterium]|nr:hypothetical protein [Erysipelotrichales bacterium]